MSRKTNEAIAKITEESMKLGDPLSRQIEEHLTEICITDAIADKILGKTDLIKQLGEKLTKVAKDKAKKTSGSSFYYMSPLEAYQLIEEFCGITAEDKAAPKKRIDFEQIMIEDLI